MNRVDAKAMSTSNTLRSRVSRETRQLLIAALIALLALWVLARIRFPGQPVNPNPIPSLLSQLSSVPRFANLAGRIAPHPKRGTVLDGRRVLLVDDVFTSGATLAASTDACLAAGAREVFVLVLARAAKDA